MAPSNLGIQLHMRLRFSDLRSEPRRLGALAGAIRNLDGVVLVEESPLTGGMLIRYEASASQRSTFWAEMENILQAHRVGHDRHRPARRGRSQAEDMGAQLVDGIASALIDKLMKGAATVLVAALL